MNTVSRGALSRPTLTRRAVVGLAALLALVLTVVGPLIPSVYAAENPDIVVTNMKLSRVDGNNETHTQGGETLRYHDNARLSFDWDASKATVKSGDSFTIDLGTYFKSIQARSSMPMKTLYGNEDWEVGTCELNAKQVICTFGADVETLIKKQGIRNLRGSGVAILEVTQATDAKNADINANGTNEVALPGEGGILGPQEYAWDLKKWASNFYMDYTRLTWGVNFGTNGKTAPKFGTTFDGRVQTLTFEDTLGEGMDFDKNMSRWTLSYRYQGEDKKVTKADGTDVTTTHGDFDIAVALSADGRTATIEVTGPFADGSNFVVEYPVTFTGGKATEGSVYKNAVAAGANFTSEHSKKYVDYFDIDTHFDGGVGDFDIAKKVEGDAQGLTADTRFPIDFTYELPSAAKNYSWWRAPGEMSSETTGVAGVTLQAGDEIQYERYFPEGTKITFTEDTSKAEGAPAGAVWGEPVITIDGKQTNTFVVENGKFPKVVVTNTLLSLDGVAPSAKPSASAEPSAQPDVVVTTGTSEPATADGDNPQAGGSSLAQTGVNAAVLIVLAAAGVGGGALVMARRRHS